MPNNYSTAANTTSSFTNIGPKAAILDLNLTLPANTMPVKTVPNAPKPQKSAPFGNHRRPRDK